MNVAYTDGGNRSNFACSAAVILSDEGRVFERHALFTGAWSNNHAEYHGVLLALRSALEIGLNQLSIFSDSKLIVNQLCGFYETRSDALRPLMYEARRLGTLLGEVEIFHVPREKNLYADAICNVEMNRIMGRSLKAWERRLNRYRLHPPSGVCQDVSKCPCSLM